MYKRQFQAFASKDTEDRSPVGSIGLNVSSSIHVGDESSDVDVSLDFGDCDISNVDVINEQMCIRDRLCSGCDHGNRRAGILRVSAAYGSAYGSR